MARPTSNYRCTECGWTTPKWAGRCGECQSWGTVLDALDQAAPNPHVTPNRVSEARAARPITEISAESVAHWPSGIAEFDRVLGGGIVPGATILLSGEPGVGKSTLLLEVASQMARQRQRVLYVTGEESAAQVRMRGDRTGAIQDELYLAAETDLGAVLGHVEQVRPTLLVIDSIQTISAGDVDGVPGGVTQVKEVAAALIRMAKLRNITLVLVGHVTKDGSIAGPRVLEHLVDVVLHFEGERSSRLRMVRAVKNRYGPVDEVGCFDLSAEGIVAITDPTGLFLDTQHGPVAGTCVAVAMEGRRPLLSEVQALVTHTSSERPRRTTSGIDPARVAMILAILQQHAGIRLHQYDVFVSSVGGARLTEPSNDLAIALALVSAFRGEPLGRQVVAIGELGLSGELRRVRDLGIRLAEAGRMGFRAAAVPAQSPESVGQSRLLEGMRVVDVDNVARALDILGMTEGELRREAP
jgi:DNA repair protein RadA/Sms